MAGGRTCATAPARQCLIRRRLDREKVSSPVAMVLCWTALTGNGSCHPRGETSRPHVTLGHRVRGRTPGAVNRYAGPLSDHADFDGASDGGAGTVRLGNASVLPEQPEPSLIRTLLKDKVLILVLRQLFRTGSLRPAFILLDVKVSGVRTRLEFHRSTQMQTQVDQKGVRDEEDQRLEKP